MAKRIAKVKTVKSVTKTTSRKSAAATRGAARKEAKRKNDMRDVALAEPAQKPVQLIPENNRKNLAAWFELYMELDGKANADATVTAKYQDLQRFLDFFGNYTGNDAYHMDHWVKATSESFLKSLKKQKSDRTGRKLAPSSINRVLATLRTAARWIHSHEPFLAGNPMQGIQDLVLDEPEWQGLEDIQVNRLRTAAEQLVHLSTRANQSPRRDYAVFETLYCTALRVSELINLDWEQLDGKYLRNVQRKGRVVTREVFLVKRARDVLGDYIEHERGRGGGPLIQTRTGRRLTIQHVDYILKRIAGQANASLKSTEQIGIYPHLLRHTMLRKVREEKGMEYAIEFAGHTSEKYIRRYTLPSREQKEATLEEIIG